MTYGVKALALKAISMGVRPPEPMLDRAIELAHLRDLLSSLFINCVIDVGANIGQFAKELRAIGYRGRIISFEPIASEFQAMRRAFEFDADWKGFQCALGSCETSLTIRVPALTVMTSLLDSIGEQKYTREEIVAVKRLDAVLPALVDDMESPKIFLKMDTQGYDMEVFKGAAGCISGICGLQSELSVKPIYRGMPHYIEALAEYEAAGFELYNLSVVSRLEDGGLLEMNCFMRRPG